VGPADLTPATVTKHNLTPGGRFEYQMTGLEGDQHRGYWEVLEIDAPHRLVLSDGFANADGTPNTDLRNARGRTRMAIEGESRRRRAGARRVLKEDPSGDFAWRLAGAVCHAAGGENLTFVQREGEIKIGDAAPNLTQQGRSIAPRT
jgi:uncharacterized protein YndB with AHSA1/START domain